MMHRILAVGSVALLLAGTAWGQGAQANLIQQKAQQIRDRNNAEQNAIANAAATPNTPSSTAGASVAPAAPTGSMSATQQQLIDRLESDFAVVKTGTAATAGQQQSMVNEMTSLAKGATKPTKPELAKLAEDLGKALSEKTQPPAATALMAKDVNIVMNCAILTPSRAQTYVSEVQNTLRKNGVSDPAIQAVTTDLKAIVDEIQKGKSKLYQ